MEKKYKIRACLYSLIAAFLIFSYACKKDEPEIKLEVFLAYGNSPVWSPDGSKIAYLNNDSLYVMSSDGKNMKSLSGMAFNLPAWSPSGNYVLFTGYRSNIYRIDVDGNNLLNLTNDAFFAYVPAWSPDGSQIAFIGSEVESSYIYLMNSDGTNLRKITGSNLNPSVWQQVWWSPDGSSLMFAAGYDFDRDIYFIDVDGTNLRRIQVESVYEDKIYLSGNGLQIYFAGSGKIYRINADGTGLVNLTGNDYTNFLLHVSPDDSKIVFGSYRDGEDGEYYMNSDGSGLVKLTLPLSGHFEGWSPDGGKILFSSLRNNLQGIYSMPTPKELLK